MIDSKKILEITYKASEIGLKYWHQGVSAEKKLDGSQVSQADRELNQLITQELAALHPNHYVVGEENFEKTEFDGEGPCWYVDPIDGTDAFLAKQPDWAIHIGLSVGGKAYFGLVAIPTSGLVFIGGEDLPAIMIDKQGKEHPLEGSLERSPENWVLVDSVYRPNSLTKTVRNHFKVKNSKAMNSVGVKAMYVAQGLGDLYASTGKCHVWDTCAPDGILKGAGIKMQNLKGEELTYRPDLSSSSRMAQAFLVGRPENLNLIRTEIKTWS